MNILTTIDQKEAEARATIAHAERELAALAEQRTQALSTAKSGDKLSQYLGNVFESSSGLTEEFAGFARLFKSELTKQLKANSLTLIGFSRGHFYVSGFAYNTATKKVAYFSTGDVRYSPDAWYNNILIRTAKHEKDYSGGSNQYATWPTLAASLLALTH